ncbi:hypothetical protein ACS8E6_02475 [Salinicola halophyticus]|uniref:hypothetical protein n=1 Tax=Salinicola halophyticus TaxID=1808881 RepID=UPI003F45871E
MLISSRNDGFGQRLKALLRTIRISERAQGLDYKFIWNAKSGEYGSFHACEPVNKVFADSYINEHYIKTFPENTKRVSSHEDLARLDSSLTYLITGRESFLDELNPSYAEEFSYIKFSENLHEAIERANTALVPPGSVALHLRGGDLCFGPLKHKSYAYQSKVVPLSLAKKLIKDKGDVGASVVLFCQDQTFKEYLRGYQNVLLPDELLGLSYEDNLTGVLSELVIMSRCDEIFGGDSAVPIVASMLSGKSLIDASEYFRKTDVIESIESDEIFINNMYDRDTLYFLNISLLYNYFSMESEESKKKLAIQNAISIDPLNTQSLFFLYYSYAKKWSSVLQSAEIIKERSGGVISLIKDLFKSNRVAISLFGEKPSQAREIARFKKTIEG